MDQKPRTGGIEAWRQARELKQAEKRKPKVPKVPTIIEETHIGRQEAARAVWWRKNRAKMDVQQLADVTGYSTQAIYLMEKGITSTGAPVKTWAWQRYKMCCAGVELYLTTCAAGEARLFNWGK